MSYSSFSSKPTKPTKNRYAGEYDQAHAHVTRALDSMSSCSNEVKASTYNNLGNILQVHTHTHTHHHTFINLFGFILTHRPIHNNTPNHKIKTKRTWANMKKRCLLITTQFLCMKGKQQQQQQQQPTLLTPST